MTTLQRESAVNWHAARARADTVRDACSRGLYSLSYGDIDGALDLSERALAELADAHLEYGVSERAADALLVLAAMAAQACESAGQMTRAKVVYGRVLRLRAVALLGRGSSCRIVRQGITTHLSGVTQPV